MRSLSHTALLAPAALLLAAPAVAQDDVRKAQQEIQRAYATVTKTYVDRDLAGYSALFTPDLTIRHADGSVWNLKQWLAFAKEDMQTVRNVRSSKMVLHHSAFRGKALVSDATEIWENDLIDVKGDYGPKGKIYPIVWQQRSTFTHIPTPKGWVLQKLEMQSAPRVTVRGKPLVPLALAAEAEIRRDYADLIRAYARHDLAGYGRYFLPDATFTLPDGKRLNRQQWLDQARTEMPTTGKVRSAKLVIRRPSLKGDTFAFDYTEVIDFDLVDTTGAYGPKGKVYPALSQQKSSAVDVRTKDGWRVRELRLLEAPRLTSGGKPLVPKK